MFIEVKKHQRSEIDTIEFVGFCSWGFTVLEMTAALTVIAILLATALPSFVGLGSSFDRSNVRSQFEFDVRRARTEALAEGAKGILVVANGGNSYTVGIDYIPFNTPPSYDTVLFKRNLPADISVSLDDDIIFDSKGYLIDDVGELTLRTVTLTENNSIFCTGSLYSTGALEYNCGAAS